MNAISNSVRSTALKQIEELDTLEIAHFKKILPMQPIYYERIDATTLQAMIEMSKGNDYVIIMMIVDQGVAKYKEMKRFPTQVELRLALEEASHSIEEADRLYHMKTNRVFTDMTNNEERDAPNDYWGDWSSDEETNDKQDLNIQQTIEDSEDSDDDDYYRRWSQEPGTLTPGVNETGGRILHSFQEEEEPSRILHHSFDNRINSFNKEEDKETAALSELTHILSNTIPNPTKRPLNHTIHPLPKVVLRSMLDADDEHGVFLHNLRNLIITAKELGYRKTDIVDIVNKLVNE